MTVTHRGRPFPARLMLLVAAAAWLATSTPVFAHAAFVSSDPQPGAEVPSPFQGPIAITYDEPLKPAGSHAELLGPSGAKVADAAIPADHPEQLIFEFDTPLAPGAYEVRWTTTGQDDEVDRGTFTITVLEPEPSPTAAPTQTPASSATAAPSLAPSIAPSPSPASSDGTPAASSTDVLFPLIAAVVAIVVLGALLLRNRRARAR